MCTFSYLMFYVGLQELVVLNQSVLFHLVTRSFKIPLSCKFWLQKQHFDRIWYYCFLVSKLIFSQTKYRYVVSDLFHTKACLHVTR